MAALKTCSHSPLPHAHPFHADDTMEEALGRRLPLPPEILLFALESLSATDLAACLRVNSGFCQLSLPILHERVRLSEHGAWPQYDDRLVPGPLSRDRPVFLQRGALVQSTRRVDVYPHTTGRCRQHGFDASGWAHALPPLPKLEVLRLFLGRFWSGRRVFHTNVDPHSQDARPATPCAALYLLHPPTLVVRGFTLVHNTVPRFELPRSLEDGVRHYVCVFEPDDPFILPRNGLVNARMAATHFRQRLPAFVTHLTLVFYPTPRNTGWRSKGASTLSWALIHAYASALWAQVIAWVTQRIGNEQAHRLTIVNVGALAAVDGDDPPRPSDMADLQRTVRLEFVAAIGERLGHTTEHAQRVLEGLEFVSMEEYLAAPDSADVFDVEDVGPWLNRGGVDIPVNAPVQECD